MLCEIRHIMLNVSKVRMAIQRYGRLLGLAGVCALLGGCLNILPTSYKIYDDNEFHGGGDFHEEFAVSQNVACEAARRTLLSQGYIMVNSNREQIMATKSFQPTGEEHVEINFHVVCIAEPDNRGKERTTVYATAVQDRYTLTTDNTSASLGLPALGSVSVPLFSSGSSLVKVGSATIVSGDFYDRFFALLQQSIYYHYQLDMEQQPALPRATSPATEAPVGNAAERIVF
ncbi:hypothetical protein CUZ56_01445 [Saezia sanguinis]|uniref:DUF2242 domain-containing protein n=2 Tax=Saezia sanguinis TaxID=1965230 RepID=A0A433SFI9_9BURK|nr:hypothetical protein CUZ56_01445 [Saezia sanguinis]